MEQLSDQQLADYKETFSMFDRDGDGTIDASELETVMNSLGIKPNATEIAEMIEKVDLDANGSIDFGEFCALMLSKQQAVEFEDEVKNVFRMMDHDGNGFIGLEDLMKVAKQMHWGTDRPPKEEDLQDMMNLFQERSSVDFMAFRKIILQTRM